MLAPNHERATLRLHPNTGRCALRDARSPPSAIARDAKVYRIEYDTIPPHEVLAWNCPPDVHLGLANPTIPTFESAETLPHP